MNKWFLLIWLTAAFTIQCLAQPATRSFNTIYSESNVDTLPTYPGGENEFYQTLQEKVRVNFSMQRFAKPGMNYLTIGFMVDTAGNYSDLQFYESDNVHVEKEIERVLAKMNRWNPAWLNGEKVNAYIYIPVKYTITDNEFLIKNVGLELAVVKNNKKNLIWKALLLAGFVTFFLITTS